MKIQLISISEIAVNECNPRLNVSAVEELADSISEVGLINPISVFPWKSGYKIESGERRFRACKKLGWKEIPCIVKSKGDAGVMLAENLARSNMGAMETMLAMHNWLVEKFGPDYKKALSRYYSGQKDDPEYLRVKKAIESVGLSSITFYQYLPVLSINKDTQKKAVEHPEYFTMPVLRKMAGVPEEVQIAAAKKIIDRKMPTGVAMNTIARLAYGPRDQYQDWDLIYMKVKSIVNRLEEFELDDRSKRLAYGRISGLISTLKTLQKSLKSESKKVVVG